LYRYALAGILALLWSISAIAAPSHSDGCISTSAVACSISGTAAAGDMAVFIVVSDAGVTVSSATDDKSDACTVGTPVNNGSETTPVYCPNLTAGAKTFTATLSGASTLNKIALDTYSGIVHTSPVDKTAGQHQATPGTGANAISSGAAGTATYPGELVWSATVNSTGAAGSGTITNGTGFTSRQTSANLFRTEDLIQTAPAAVTGTFTAGNAGDSFNTIVISFQIGATSSKIVGFAALNNIAQESSKIVGFAVLAGSQEALSKSVGFAVLCTPTTGVNTGNCAIPPPKGGMILQGFP
jgi:hypothetical protein